MQKNEKKDIKIDWAEINRAESDKASLEDMCSWKELD